MKNRFISGALLLSVFLLGALITGSVVDAQASNFILPSSDEATATALPTTGATGTAEATASSDEESASTDDSTSSESSSSLTEFEAIDLINIGISALIFFLFYSFGGRLVISILKKLAKRSPSEFVDQLIELIAPDIGKLITVLGLQFATLRLDFIGDSLRSVLENIFFLFYWYVGMRIAWNSIIFSMDWYFDRVDKEDRGGMFEQLRPLLKRVSQIILVFSGVVILLTHFGVSALTIMATLGMTGFALSLALRDTLTNIISGFIIMATQPFTVGDRIEISAIDGWADVVDIGYRSTTCLARDNRQVIVPNGIIVDNTIINYSRPDPSYRLQTDLGIGGDMDILKVVKILKETVRDVDGVMKEKPIDVLFTEYGESTMTLRVRWWIKSYADKRRVTHQVMNAIQDVSVKENINMPDPAFLHDTTISIKPEELDKISKVLKE